MIGLIRHLVWHDMHSQRHPLLLWTGLLALQAAMLFMDSVPQSRLLTGPWIPMIRYLVTAVLAALIVQRDLMVGTTAFWRTRPIPRAVLFASKMVSLTTALVVLPWLVFFATFGSLGSLVVDAMRAATSVAAEQAVVTLLAVMAACVTSSLTQLVVAGGAGSTLVTAFNYFLLPAILTTWPFIGQSVGGGRPAVYMATLCGLGVPVIAHHYLTLREWRTAALVALVLLGATVVTRAWPEDDPAVAAPLADRSAVNPDAVAAAIDVETMTVTEENETVASGVVRMKRLAVGLTADGQPDGVLLWPVAIDSRLLLPDQTVPYHTGRIWPGVLSVPRSTTRKDLFHRAVQSALGSSVRLSQSWSTLYARPADPVVVMSLPADVVDRHTGQQAILTADVTFLAERYRVRDIIPARRGERFACPGFAFEVTSASAGINGATVVLREVRVVSYDSRSWTTNWSTFVLRNLARKEAFTLRRGGQTPGVSLTSRFLLMGEGVSSVTWLVPASTDSTQLHLDKDWFAGAEIVRVEHEDLGTFERPLHAEFTVKQ